MLVLNRVSDRNREKSRVTHAALNSRTAGCVKLKLQIYLIQGARDFLIRFLSYDQSDRVAFKKFNCMLFLDTFRDTYRVYLYTNKNWIIK